MAKAVKAKGSTLSLLRTLFAKFPTDKLQENSSRVNNFFRAVKKPLRKYIDQISDLQKEARKSVKDLSAQLQKETDEAKKKEINDKISVILQPFNDQLTKLDEEITNKSFEAVFDTEDFNFVEEVFTAKPSDFFSIGRKGEDGKEIKLTDFDSMDLVMEFFESAYNPDAK
jgi:ElaB/YqjD/DUF883 family membrane-anchored ribosome-binding protein